MANDVPDIIDLYTKQATLVEEFDHDSDHAYSFCAIGRQDRLPALVVIQRYSPAGWGAYPGILIVPETHIA